MSWLSLVLNLDGVRSAFGRRGPIVAQRGDYAASQVVDNSAAGPGTTVAEAIDALYSDSENVQVAGLHGRTGAVVSKLGDYSASQVDNDSAVPGATAADAIDALYGRLARVEVVATVAPDAGGYVSINPTGFSDADIILVSVSTAFTARPYTLGSGTEPARKRKRVVNVDDTYELVFQHHFALTEPLRCPGGTSLTIAPGEAVDCYYTDGLWYLQPGAP